MCGKIKFCIEIFLFKKKIVVQSVWQSFLQIKNEKGWLKYHTFEMQLKFSLIKHILNILLRTNNVCHKNHFYFFFADIYICI